MSGRRGMSTVRSTTELLQPFPQRLPVAGQETVEANAISPIAFDSHHLPYRRLFPSSPANDLSPSDRIHRPLPSPIV